MSSELTETPRINCPFNALSLHLTERNDLIVGGLGKIGCLDTKTGDWKIVSLPQQEVVTHIRSAKKSFWLFFATSNRNVYRIETNSFKTVSSLDYTCNGPILDISNHESHRKIFIWSKNGILAKVNSFPTRLEAIPLNLNFSISCVTHFNNLMYAAIGAEEGKCWKVKIDREEKEELAKFSEPISTINVTFDERMLLIGLQNSVIIFHMSNKNIENKINLRCSSLKFIASDQFSRTVLTISTDGTMIESSFDSGETMNSSKISNGCFFLSTEQGSSTLITCKKTDISLLALKYFGLGPVDKMVEECKTLISKVEEVKLSIRRLSNIFIEKSRILYQQLKEIELEEIAKISQAEEATTKFAEELQETKSKVRAKRVNAVKCISCYENPAVIWYQPCNHVSICKECLSNPLAISTTQKCLLCKEQVKKKLEIGRYLRRYPLID